MAGGTEVRFVGGCVRDAAIARPVKDIDIATPDLPEIATRKLEAAGIKVVPTGIDHGTVTAVVEHRPYEITTLRRDIETYGRHAKVAFTDDWQADAARRDFTMNALSCRTDGSVFDYFGGLADLRAGNVRFVGEPSDRIAEDILRILRFYRFIAHYGHGDADAAGRAACRGFAAKLPTLSGERLRDETVKLLRAPGPHIVMAHMAEDGVTAAYLPEAAELDRLERLVAVEAAFPGPAAPDAILRLAAVVRDHADIGALAARLRFSNKDRDRLAILHAREPVLRFPAERLSTRRLFYRHGAATIADRARLAVARGEGDAAQLGRVHEWATAWQPAPLPVTGKDAMALGIPEGEAIGRVLKAVEDWWMDADFEPRRAEALNKLREIASADIERGQTNE